MSKKSHKVEKKEMSERTACRIISAVMLVLAVVGFVLFVTTGLSVGWLFFTAAFLVGSFMAFAVSFAAP